MKSNRDIVMELYDTKFVQNYVKKKLFNPTYVEDVIQDVFLILLEHPMLPDIYNKGGINKIRGFASGIIQRYLSVKGKGWRLYTRELSWTENIIPDETYTEKNVY